jgi:hypothetical protein
MDDPTLRSLIESYNEMYASEDAEELEEKKGLWDNIHAKRERGERPAKPGEKGYPKTLNVEENEIEEGLKQARKNVGASKCWPGKVARGTKMKGGKEVPDCKPVKQADEAYDVVLDYLMSEGYAKDVESADKIMMVMSADKIQEIVEQSALAQRAAAAVDDQRRGSYGMADDLNKTRKALDKLKPYPNGFPGVKPI